MPAMKKLTFRVTLLGVLLGLVFVTVVGLGVTSRNNAAFIAQDLSAQVLEQTSLRVDHQINDLLLTANEQSDLNRGLLDSGLYRTDDFPGLAPYWLQVMKAQPKLTRISLGLEASGEWSYVRRLPNGKLAVGELRRNTKSGKLELSDYWPEDYPRKPFYFNPDKDDEDPRRRPWYVAARRAGKQAWSETYVLFGTQGYADVPGVSCATPLYRDGALVGAITATFDLYELSAYLKTLTVGKNGFAFVVEYR